MSNHIAIPLTKIILKAGDRVRLVEPEVLIERANNYQIEYKQDENGVYSFNLDDNYLSFKSCDVLEEMLNELYKWDTQEIESIDEDGDIKFVDMPYTWPKEVILEPVDEIETYNRLCNYYYNDDALARFMQNNDYEEKTTEVYDNFYKSKEYYGFEDNSNVVIIDIDI